MIFHKPIHYSIENQGDIVVCGECDAIWGEWTGGVLGIADFVDGSGGVIGGFVVS